MRFKCLKQLDLKILLIIIAIYLSFKNYRQVQHFKEANYDVSMQFFKKNLNNEALNTKVYFIGGSPRSGANLMAEILSSHPLVNFVNETNILPFFLLLHGIYTQNSSESKRLDEARINRNMIKESDKNFVLNIINGHQKDGKYLCIKESTSSLYIEFLSEMLPNSKFIHMVRDARAIIQSVHEKPHKVYNDEYYENKLMIWNEINTVMYTQCMIIGAERCLPVYFEQVVLYPEREMKKILRFLDIPWNEAILKKKSILDILSKKLNSWSWKIPKDVLETTHEYVPFNFNILGYDTKFSSPSYLNANSENEKKTNYNQASNNRDYWLSLQASNYSILMAYRKITSM